MPADLQTVGRAHRGELRAGAVHRAVHGRRRRFAARRRHRKSGAADALGQGCADAGHLRRRAGLCLAGRRHHLHGRCDAACRPAPSATCRRRRWWRRSSSRCGCRIMPRSAATWIMCGRWRRCKDSAEVRQMPRRCAGTARMRRLPQIALLPDGKRLHLQDGPIDLIVEAEGARPTCARPIEAAARRFTGLLDELCARTAGTARARPIRGDCCCRASSRAACMLRWRRSLPITSSRRWRRSPARWPRKFSARCCEPRRWSAPMSTMAAISRCISAMASVHRSA